MNESPTRGVTTIADTINLNNLTDIQKSFLTQLSYLDINHFGMRKCKNVGIKIKDLTPFLLNPDIPFCGTASIIKSKFDKVTSIALGDYKIWTDSELLTHIVELGLGDIIITEVQSDTQSGFQAIAFKDAFGNIGISFRGSDLDLSQGGLLDWIEADFIEYFTNDSTQRHRAIAFFQNSKSADGNNYLYGHSLGGNLASHVYVQFHQEIEEVFAINGYPINQKLIDTQEKIDAFNSPKYIFNSICGDVVSHLKSCDLYQDNVRWLQNNEKIKSSILSAHLVQSASYDDNGKFIEMPREEMVQKMGKAKSEFAAFTQKIRNDLNILENRAQQSKARRQETFEKYKGEFSDWLKRDMSIEIEKTKPSNRLHIRGREDGQIPEVESTPEFCEASDRER